jgi:hypothetical protein
MSKRWTENLEENISMSVDQAIKDADRAIHDFILHRHWSHWHPISTAPYNLDLELRVVAGGVTSTLEFPCRHTNAGEWINSDLGTPIQIQPAEWRVWQRGMSAPPHRSAPRATD